MSGVDALVKGIRLVCDLPADTPAEELPELVRIWGLRKEADGICEGRHLELMRHLGEA
jgi:hypothetical protein